MLHASVRWLTIGAGLLAAATSARGQATANFDTLVTGTIVTTQYTGVTFSIFGGTGNPTIQATAAGSSSVNTTSSGTRFLAGAVGTTCPTLPALRLVFTDLQRRVTFKTGIAGGLFIGPPTNLNGQDVTITAYDNAGTQLGTLTTTVWVTAANSGRIDQLVTIGNAATGARNIRRIEVTAADHGGSGLCRVPYIDDLVYCDALNTADPTVSLTSPAQLSCICPGSSLSVSGTISAGACGGYASDELDYRPLSGGAWTVLAGPYTTLPGTNGDEFTGLLYSAVVPSTLNGWYEFRSVTHTDTGRSASDVVVVYVDNTPPTVFNPTPVDATIVRGQVCINGEVTDSACGATYVVEYKPTLSPSYIAAPTAGAVWPQLAVWNTVGLAAGDYNLRITATDGCGNVTVSAKVFTVDNIAPVARIDSPVSCSYQRGMVQVRGQATDTNLAGWVVQYSGGDSHGWVTIASGATQVASGGTLANWNTAGLRACAYTVRLVVSDQATDNCGGGGNSSEYEVSVDLGCQADYNRSGGLEVQDIFDFLAGWFAGCP